jgi:2-polyprenyl-3-methyl-5-hydroxy-6-metoxy-1,4-benzoquinol methylase
MAHWTEKFFVKDGRLWLYVMDHAWKHAPLAVRGIARILKKNRIRKSGKILEIACGNGRICTGLAKKGFKVTGIDISPLYIADARIKARKLKIKNIDYICGDIRSLDKHVKGKFDVVISIFTAIGYYDRKTDERIFKKVSHLLKPTGLFLVLNTMSRERLLSIYCSGLYEEVGDYYILHKGKFDRAHSINNESWIFYKKAGKNLKYVDKLDLQLRIYGSNEIVDMAEQAGMQFVDAYDLLSTLKPLRTESGINMVFRKVRKK